MKKLSVLIVAMMMLVGSLFAESKTYTIDLGDSSLKTIEIAKNPYGTNYQCKAPAVFTKFFKGDMPAPGDKIEVHYNLKSDKDLSSLILAIVDNSEKANYWLPLANQYEPINNLTAGTFVEGVIVFNVETAPVKDITVQFMYDETINSKITLQKAGVKTGRK